MASALKIRSGTKLQLAFDAPVGKEPVFDMICTFGKAVDESAFLISVPMRTGQALALKEDQKFLVRYGQGDEARILACYPDDLVKDGIRRYWKMRRVSEQRQFFQRADERLKAAIRVTYCQATWPLNADGGITREEGMTLDVSAGGAAIYLNRRLEVGEVCEVTFPRIGTAPDGQAVPDVTAAVCWLREAPKGSLYRNICGLQFRFDEGADRERMQVYVAHVKKKYRL